MTEPLASFRSLYGPDWRWRLANKSTRRQLARLGPDEILRRAHHYCALLNQDDGNPLAAHAEPAIARAVALNGQYEYAVRLKIMTLGGLPLDEISRRSALDFEVITTWQALFFDLVGMDGARDWCSAHIIAPEERAGHGDIALQLKMARSGGPAAARLLLDAAAEAPIDELKQLERRREKLHLLL